jgi:hypothetical protein
LSDVETTLPFHIGRQYDEDRASDGVTRFGVYAREAFAADTYPWDLDEDADRRIASIAWRAATPPVMAPGYVRYHHLITGASISRSGWDGTLNGYVTLVTPPPAAIATMRRWRDWEHELEGDRYRPVGPYEEQISAIAQLDYAVGYALTTVELVFPLPAAAAALPAIPASPDAPDLAHVAAVAVGVLVGALNDLITPVIEAL